MTSAAVDDVLQWASKQSDWKRDALRRLASGAKLTPSDHNEIMDQLRAKAGYPSSGSIIAPVPLTKADMSVALSGVPLKLKAIKGVTGINQLKPQAALDFEANGITIVYGRNGSGKSGFVRIFRTACRTRIDKPEKLKILADVYGGVPGVQEAELVIDKGAGDVPIKWVAGQAALDDLVQVSVFDSAAAQLYIDEGNQVQFLPFGMSLPLQLNELCLTLRAQLEQEDIALQEKIMLAEVALPSGKTTKALAFYNGITGVTTDEVLAASSAVSAEALHRLQELEALLSGLGESPAALRDFATFLDALAEEATGLCGTLSDAALMQARNLRTASTDARKLASLKAKDLFSDEPLQDIGGEAWRTLWLAAREYSTTAAYPDGSFPVLQIGDDSAACVLCQQAIGAEAGLRMQRFADFMTDTLEKNAEALEQQLAAAVDTQPVMASFAAKTWPARYEQLHHRDAPLAISVANFRTDVATRLNALSSELSGALYATPPPSIANPSAGLNKLATSLREVATELESAGDAQKKQALEEERAELLDLKELNEHLQTLKTRRDLLLELQRLKAAVSEVQTTNNTKMANTLVEGHLKKDVLDRFAEECKAFEIAHLKIALERKSGKEKAEFQTKTGSSLVKRTSEFLSEGEQRALALAAFLTEVAVTDGAGPIVVDDPVSSLDRQRGKCVAQRLVEEAKFRQVIVFTHDLIFYNDLCRAADEQNVPSATIALFRDAAHAGKVDPAGVSWKGKSVTKRLGPIKQELPRLKKLHGSSPSEYERESKNVYGRLRDCYEKAVEEIVFCQVVQRGVDDVQTQMLRYVHVSHDLAIRFHEGMSRANTHSHDNPASETVASPDPAAVEADINAFEKLVADFKGEQAATEQARPSMKKKV